MIPFHVFCEQASSKFVGLYFASESEEALRNWALMSGFDLTSKYDGTTQSPSEFDFHTTIFFSTNFPYVENGVYEVDPFELELDHFELLGKEKNIPVIKINTDNWQLQMLRKGFEDMGFKDEWPEYKPHISLSYNYNGKPDLSELTLPPVKVIANRIVVS